MYMLSSCVGDKRRTDTCVLCDCCLFAPCVAALWCVRGNIQRQEVDMTAVVRALPGTPNLVTGESVRLPSGAFQEQVREDTEGAQSRQPALWHAIITSHPLQHRNCRPAGHCQRTVGHSHTQPGISLSHLAPGFMLYLPRSLPQTGLLCRCCRCRCCSCCCGCRSACTTCTG